jgi:MscS family membrane protein
MKIKSLSISVITTSLVLIVLQGLLLLARKDIIELSEVMEKIISRLSLIIAIFFFISVILRFSLKRVFNWFEEPEEKIFYTKIYSWSLYSLGVFFILYDFGVSLGNLTLFVGLIATGLAFAVRDVLISYFAWLILLRKKPFRIGDHIRIGEDEGKVLHIGTFYVLLDSTDDLPEDYIRVPNKVFMEKSIHNLGARTLHEKLSFQLTGWPKDKNQRLEDLQQKVLKILNRKDHLRVYTDMKNDKICLNVEYLVSFKERQQLRSDVIDLTIDNFCEVVNFSK